MMKKIGNILAEYRKEKKLLQGELAKELEKYDIHVSNAAISAWEKDVSYPNAHQFLALCKILDITKIYETFVGTHEDDPLSGLNEAGKEKVLDYISLLLLSDQYKKADDNIIPFRRKIRWSLLASSAGTGDFLDDENFELIEVGSEVPELADFGLALNGDSMEPRYHDNQAVWVQQTNSLNNGDIGIFYLDGKTYCKQIKKTPDGLFLVSLNAAYKPIPVREESSFRIFGRVLN